MKKCLLLSVFLFFVFAISAQITQEQADNIVLERLDNETNAFSLYAKEKKQESFILTTSNSETIELEYACWVYFAKYTGKTNHKYLIVKESNGNLLEINVKNDEGPENIEEWRILYGKVWFMEHSLSETLCTWGEKFHDLIFPHGLDTATIIIINSNEELEDYINCVEGDYPSIDFTRYSLILLFHAKISHFNPPPIVKTFPTLHQISANEYELRVEEYYYEIPKWCASRILIPLITNKFEQNITFHVNYSKTWTSCKLKNLNYPFVGAESIVINSTEEYNNYFEDTDGIAPEIDFTKHTLLLVNGGQKTQVVTGSKLVKTGENSFEYKLRGIYSMIESTEVWVHKELVAKLPQGTNISVSYY
jgi:hypothetical protein